MECRPAEIPLRPVLAHNSPNKSPSSLQKNCRFSPLPCFHVRPSLLHQHPCRADVPQHRRDEERPVSVRGEDVRVGADRLAHQELRGGGQVQLGGGVEDGAALLGLKREKENQSSRSATSVGIAVVVFATVFAAVVVAIAFFCRCCCCCYCTFYCCCFCNAVSKQ